MAGLKIDQVLKWKLQGPVQYAIEAVTVIKSPAPWLS